MRIEKHNRSKRKMIMSGNKLNLNETEEAFQAGYEAGLKGTQGLSRGMKAECRNAFVHWFRQQINERLGDGSKLTT
jgi:hypothetical protein